MFRAISLSRCWTFSKLKFFRLSVQCSLQSDTRVSNLSDFKEKLSKGPSLSNFIKSSHNSIEVSNDHPPYLSRDQKNSRKVYIETYGCQMNVNDTEIINSILKSAGFTISNDVNETDVIFLVTCAIREGAEQKIWNKLNSLRHLKKKNSSKSTYPIKIGVLGCMAERLKHQLLEKEKMVDIVAGPDSYKDLPNLLSLADSGQKAVNVMLSADETYADILPVRVDSSSKSAFVSIMRGCDNMCTFCIVPFTRGRERSRSVSSIVDEVRYLSDLGVKEVTLLGQNVNSYRDISVSTDSQTVLSSGFSTVYKSRSGGLPFAHLLHRVASVDPEMRIRFTSPHPKDFPDEVLHVINERPNICKLLHLPAQSGNSEVLSQMRRGYTREAYLDLIDHIRSIIPDVAFTSDFICGFCDETEDQHQDTLSLIEKVKYENAYIFPYSMREKTRAYRQLNDNVPVDVKKQRALEAYNLFRACALQLHQKEIGSYHLVQVLGPSKRCELDWSGRNDWNTKVIFPYVPVPFEESLNTSVLPSSGEYVVIQITGCSSQVLKGKALYRTTLQNYYSNRKIERMSN